VGLIDTGDSTPFLVGQPFPVIDLSDEVATSPGLAGVVVSVSWSQLEPTQGSFDFSTIDASLSAVQAYNTEHPNAQLGVRLRVFGANGAPDWAKNRTRAGDRDLERRWHDTRRRSNGGAVLLRGHGV
jgi:hypothetical protein